jgi:hypothetical protein
MRAYQKICPRKISVRIEKEGHQERYFIALTTVPKKGIIEILTSETSLVILEISVCP